MVVINSSKVCPFILSTIPHKVHFIFKRSIPNNVVRIALFILHFGLYNSEYKSSNEFIVLEFWIRGDEHINFKNFDEHINLLS